MKNNYRYKIRCVLMSIICFLHILSASPLEARSFEIALNNDTHSLVAEGGGCAYQWYKDGSKLEGESDRFLSVNEGGEYTVEILEEDGEISSPKAVVAVTATGAIIRIYLLGDSTVSNYNATNQYPQTGWGQIIGKFFNTANIQVINKAVGGRSSRSYYSGPNQIWPGFKDQIQAGDYAFIQFGHNDASTVPERYTSVPDYKIYLKKYIDELKAKGAFPVLVTPMIQNYWNANNTAIQRSLSNYAGAMIEVATTEKVPLVDLNLQSYNLYKTFTKDYTTRFIYNTYVANEYPLPSDFNAGNINNGKNGDGTHFQVMGAIENSRIIIDELKKLKADVHIAALVNSIKPQYQIAISVNPKGSDIATTRTTTYPEETTITLKTLPKAGTSFVKWIDAQGKTVSTKTLVTTVVTGAAPTSYTAVYAGAVLGIDENTLIEEFALYPNPFTHSLSIDLKGSFEYAIYDMAGIEMEKGSGENTKTVGSSLKAGIYLVKVQTSAGSKFVKVAKD